MTGNNTHKTTIHHKTQEKVIWI